MKISFAAVEREHALQIASWRYDAPYAIYDYRNQSPGEVVQYLTDPEHRFFAVLRDKELIGFRSFGEDGRVSGGHYDDSCLDTGGGLRPDLTGRGLGARIIRKGIEFGSQTFGTTCFRVTIAAFNLRALRACERVGFKEDHRFHRASDNEEFVVLQLKPEPKA